MPAQSSRLGEKRIDATLAHDISASHSSAQIAFGRIKNKIVL
jgi:hypothetical protein